MVRARKGKKKSKFIGRRRPRALIDLLAIGEGPQKSRVFERAERAAERNASKKFVILDLKKPGYELPSTLQFFSQDAIRFLEHAQMNSVKRIEDKYFFSFSLWGKNNSPEGILKTAEQMKRELASAKITGTIKQGGVIEKTRRNTQKYLKHVKRVLVPGGKFVLMADPESVQTHSKLLREAGFNVTSRQLSREQIMKSGSKQAVLDLKRGLMANYIIATKPKPRS